MKLYITVETTSRELEAKTFLACSAAMAGFDVVIGLEDMVRRLAMLDAPGVFFDKSLHSEYPVLFKKLKQLGHAIAVIDEEGLVVDDDQYCKFGISQEIKHTVDMIFAWGAKHQELVYRSLPSYPGKVVLAGNPRMDILREQLRPFHQKNVDAIKKEYGDFTLINTRYGFYNHVSGGEAYKEQIRRGDFGDKIEYLLNYYDFEGQLFEAFLTMTRALSQRYPQRTFVLRPHPSEDIVRWKDALSGLKNVLVVREGNVHAWILASDFMIHNGCSTAIESFLLGVPSIAYRPVLSAECDLEFPNSVSLNLFSLDELFQCLDDTSTIKSKIHEEAYLEALKEYIHSVSGELSVDILVRELLELAKKKQDYKLTSAYFLRGEAYLRHLTRAMRYFLKKIRHKESRNINTKWVPYTCVEFQKIVEKFYFYNEDFKKLEISDAYYDCFRIRKRRVS